VLRTGADLLTDRQHARLQAVFADERHVEVEATWGIYQRIVGLPRSRPPGSETRVEEGPSPRKVDTRFDCYAAGRSVAAVVVFS